MVRCLDWICIIGLLVATSCHGPKKAARGESPNSKPATAKSEVPARLENVSPSHRTKEEAIKAGLAYLAKQPWEFQFVYLYSYLQPKFGWPDLPAMRETEVKQDSLRRVGDIPAARISDQLTLFRRLINPQFEVSRELFGKAQEEDAFTVIALYCDQYAIDTASYFPVLRNEMANGGYRLTHALLAALWLDEHQCAQQGSLALIRTSLKIRTKQLVETLPEWNDLRIEAASLLQASGEILPTTWVESVVDAQQSNGGWTKESNSDASDTHATILALWMLAGSK